MIQPILEDDLPASRLENHESEGTFGPCEILGHLIHGERTDWVPRIKLILDRGASQAFEPFDRRGYGDARGVSTGVLLDELETMRRSNLALASLSLSPSLLALKGLHPELGPVTPGQLLATWVSFVS